MRWRSDRATPPVEPPAALVIVKVVHTVVWVFLATCVLAIPVCARRGHLRAALVLTGIVLAETAVLVLNPVRCPLTDLAARYTTDRAANFDIYLPEWLARHNQQVFGSLFVVGELVLLRAWWLKRSGVARDG